MDACLDRVIPLGETHPRGRGRLARRERLGGLLNYYYREAA